MEADNHENSKRLIDKKRRKLGMLIAGGRAPEHKEKIRMDFKRREKLVEMKEKVRRARQTPKLEKD